MAVEQKGLRPNNSDNSKTQTPREFGEAYEARRGSSQTLRELADTQRKYNQMEGSSYCPLIRMIPSDW